MTRTLEFCRSFIDELIASGWEADGEHGVKFPSDPECKVWYDPETLDLHMSPKVQGQVMDDLRKRGWLDE